MKAIFCMVMFSLFCSVNALAGAPRFVLHCRQQCQFPSYIDGAVTSVKTFDLLIYKSTVDAKIEMISVETNLIITEQYDLGREGQLIRDGKVVGRLDGSGGFSFVDGSFRCQNIVMSGAGGSMTSQLYCSALFPNNVQTFITGVMGL